MVLGAGEIKAIAYTAFVALAIVIAVVIVKCGCDCLCSRVEEEDVDSMQVEASNSQEELTDVVLHV